MNDRVTVNPQLVLSYDFKHLFNYKLLHHVMAHYDDDIKRVHLDKHELILKYNSNYHTINNAIEELKANAVIDNYNHYKNWYKVNSNVFIQFRRGLTKIV